MMDSRTQEVCWALIRESRQLLDWCKDRGDVTPSDTDGKDMLQRLEKACQDLTRRL